MFLIEITWFFQISRKLSTSIIWMTVFLDHLWILGINPLNPFHHVWMWVWVDVREAIKLCDLWMHALINRYRSLKENYYTDFHIMYASNNYYWSQFCWFIQNMVVFIKKSNKNWFSPPLDNCAMCWTFRWDIDSKDNTVTSYPLENRVYHRRHCIIMYWLCYPIGTFGIWRDV